MFTFSVEQLVFNITLGLKSKTCSSYLRYNLWGAKRLLHGKRAVLVADSHRNHEEFEDYSQNHYLCLNRFASDIYIKILAAPIKVYQWKLDCTWSAGIIYVVWVELSYHRSDVHICLYYSQKWLHPSLGDSPTWTCCQPSWMIAITRNHKNGCYGPTIKIRDLH